jgi:hypothetical protein
VGLVDPHIRREQADYESDQAYKALPEAGLIELLHAIPVCGGPYAVRVAGREAEDNPSSSRIFILLSLLAYVYHDRTSVAWSMSYQMKGALSFLKSVPMKNI